MERAFRRLLPRGGGRRRPRGDRCYEEHGHLSSFEAGKEGEQIVLTSQDPVDVARTTPLLVCENVAADLLLLALDELDVGEHAVCLVPLRELSWSFFDGAISGRGRGKGKGNDEPVTTAVLCRPARETSWSTKPDLPRSQMKDLSCSSLNPCADQLNEGERL